MLEQPQTKWDNWLRDGLVTPSVDFHTKVMARVAQLAPQPVAARPGRLMLAAQALALSAAALAGLAQLAMFSFGIWSATAAG